ncbi:MAG TPA: 2TM domain-containing protein, partial [Ramlibacter sp.]
MPTPLSPEELERLAHKRANAKMGWYLHATVFVVVNGFLLLSSTLGYRVRAYNLAPALGWGLGLVLHFVSVFLMGKGSTFREDM